MGTLRFVERYSMRFLHLSSPLRCLCPCKMDGDKHWLWYCCKHDIFTIETSSDFVVATVVICRFREYDGRLAVACHHLYCFLFDNTSLWVDASRWWLIGNVNGGWDVKEVGQQYRHLCEINTDNDESDFCFMCFTRSFKSVTVLFLRYWCVST